MKTRWLGITRMAVVLVLGAGPSHGGSKPASAPTTSGQGHDSLDGLVAAERAFAAYSIEHGMRDAFLAFLAEDGVLFRPRAVNGKQAWTALAPPTAQLAWEPAFAAVAASGDLGYTTGPWEFTPQGQSAPAGYGHFISVWRKQKDGAWRVMADIGVSHAAEARGVGSGDFTPGPPAPSTRKASAELLAAAADPVSLDRSATGNGRVARQMMLSAASADVRFNTDGELPVVGASAAAAALDSLAEGRLVRFIPAHGEASAARDLIYSFGVAEFIAQGFKPDSCMYLNVWRLGTKRRWELTMSVVNPLPKRAP